ncbi:glycosyltransferase family 4 protein [Thermocoleostomius sinensis]|uniref:Glycosyltransferase family 1 protein n=1 Tax=Thermocoleostomius sinensis A174 TaxID=2016057 RepID=A0A9E9CBQ0_9CYAN|nr:glycosyltransferase family 1 protein [Thermocoleostomius sinensis]WAL62762.1 glycosyltransferase family 1 protein [Thermocoleostomius sinensis A174]
MRVAIIRRTRTESFSMDVYADGIVSGLKAARPNWEIVELAPQRFTGTIKFVNQVQRYYERYWHFPRVLMQQPVDVFHIIDHSDGHLAYWLQKQRQPTIVTCHDIINLTQPETYKGRAQYPWLSMSIWKYAIWGMHKASHVVSVSSYTADEVVQWLGLDRSRITVIPNAVDEKFRVLPTDEIRAFRQQQGIAADTFCLLNVGSNHIRKNVSTILEVVALLKSRGLPIHFWKAGTDFNTEQQQFIQAHQLQDCVSYVGEPDDRALVQLYNAADVLVAPSLSEGFGLTVLEAMACGTPVIASNVTSLPEVVGEAGYLVHPTDVESIAKAVYQLQTDLSCCNCLKEKGIERAKQFTWRKTGERIAEVYETLLEQGH